MKKLYTMVVGLFLIFQLNALTVWNGNVDANWSNLGNWSTGLPGIGNDAVIPSGLTVYPVISTATTFDYNVSNSGIITSNAAIINNGTVSNFGTGKFNSNDAFTNNMTINNSGDFMNSGDFVNDGMFDNSGMINNMAGSTFMNNTGILVNNFGTFYNLGIVTNHGTWQNYNIITNAFQFINDGVLQINNGSSFVNETTGAVYNNVGGSILINDQLLNDGFFENSGITTVGAAGDVINNLVIDNQGTFDNGGQITNNNSLDNHAVFINNFGGSMITNNSVITNFPCALFYQYSSSMVGDSFLNNGTIYQIGGQINSSGDGIILNNVNSFPTPTVVCNNLTVPLGSDGTVEVTLEDIDAGSSASYCGIETIFISNGFFDCSNIGLNNVLLSVTDFNGVSGFCTAQVMVTDEPPLIECPDDIVLAANPFECSRVVTFDVPTATDNCDFTFVQNDGTGLTSGDVFPIGITTLSYVATDQNGDETYCTFNIEIQEYSSGSNVFACNNHFNFSLDNNCEAYLNPSLILEGLYGCIEDFSIEVTDVDGNDVGHYINEEYVGQTLTVTVIRADDLHSCWGTVLIEDKVGPEITGCDDIVIWCNQEADPILTGTPVATDACGETTLTYTDEIENFECSDNYIKTITRTWLATDEGGNTATCQQVINFKRPTLGDIDLPQNLDDNDLPALDCNDPCTDPSCTGYPSLNGIALSSEDLCQFGYTYTDQTIALCGTSYKLLRHWQVLDWCSNDIVDQYQIIKVIDTTAPELVCVPALTASTDPYSCEATFTIPAIEVSDDCSEVVVAVTLADGTELSVGDELTLPLGESQITYIATDECGNISLPCVVTIEIVDDRLPNAVCDQNTVVAVGQDGNAQVCWETIEDGSYDNCGIVEYKIKRADSNLPFSECVDFSCADIGTSVEIIFMVTDAAGNSNTCSVFVNPSDKLDPIITCPADVTIDCDEDFSHIYGVYDNPVFAPAYLVTDEGTTFIGNYINASDNCDGLEVFITETGDTDFCGGGVITRTYTAVDRDGRTDVCTQTITVVNSLPFYINPDNDLDPFDNVIWPLDYETEACGSDLEPDALPYGYDRPHVAELPCSQIVVTYTEEELIIEEDACLKILRHWKVVDWCQFDFDNNLGIWTYTQIIKVHNNIAPTFDECAAIEVCSFASDCSSNPVVLTTSATDDCTNQEDINYTYEVDQFNDGTVQHTGSGSTVSLDYPLGLHSITWKAEDGCGNISSCTYTFDIVDCKQPTPVCINGISTVLMPLTGTIAIWPSDLEAQSSFDNCTDYEDLEFRIRKGSDETSLPVDLADLPTSVEFECIELGYQTLEIWVGDEAGNWDFCETYVFIQDNNATCGENITFGEIAGIIETEEAEMIENVNINLVGGNSVPNITGASGSFAFPSVPMYTNYTVAPEKNTNFSNGVTTMDLVIINRHILNITPLDSPYKMIAADANRSNSVTTIDMVLIRKLILNIDSEFSNNTSWRFIEADFVFPDPTDPFLASFPEVINVNNFSTDELNSNFVGVKIGDVNNSATPNNLIGAAYRGTNTLNLVVEDQSYDAGSTLEVAFKAKDFKNILGYQFSLNFDTDELSYVSTSYELQGLGEDNFGFFNMEDGIITTSWDDIDLVNLPDDAILFTMKFNAVAKGQLSHSLSINDRVTRAEAYRGDEVVAAALLFNNESGTIATTKFELFQNQPNPFSGTTTIGFQLPEAGHVVLTVSDIAGRTLEIQAADFEKGYNELRVDGETLQASGIFYYKIETANHSEIRKMLLID